MLICKLCKTELVEFGPKFYTHKYQNGKCKVYVWDKRAYKDEELANEDPVVSDNDSSDVRDSGF